MLRKNENKALPFGKLLWYDPNPTDDEPIDLSELTISVDLEVTSKSRSIIITNSSEGSTSIVNTGESNIVNVNFFNGSKNESTGSARALTTNYTNLQDLTTDIDNDFEALGIESIDITFNSSYAPTVKIKFIDIRGAAIFSHGGSGKYKFFFELPYPIFKLTVKGYYGRPVQYCLHLLRFNASFNSQTGNFEIDCDFIGFTYALLTDMLMGLVRASVTTKRGQKVFNEIKSEYKNQNSIITIDELVVRISEIDETVKKLKKGEEVVRFAVNQQARVEVENLKQMVKLHLDEYANGAKNFTTSYGNGVLIIAEPNESQKEILKDSKIKYITEVIEQITKKIKINGDKGLINFDSTDVNDQKIQKQLDTHNNEKCNYFAEDYGYILKYGFKVSDTKDADKIKGLYPEKSEQRVAYMTTLLNDISFGTTEKITIIDLSRAIKACDISLLALDDQNEVAIKDATDKLKIDIRSVLGFDPTIRNLFRILCTSTEVFLQCMLDVSKEAERDAGGRRAKSLAKLGPNLNNNPKSSKIFPWPEYRKKGVQNDGYYEEWMGNEIPATDVPELLFTEELLQEMILQARQDKAREADLNGGNDWYPISVIDTPVDNGLRARMLNNPYKIGLMEELPGVVSPTGTPDEALRVMMYRAFLLLGIAHRNDISEILIKTHAKLEAENLYDVLRKMPDVNVARKIKGGINGTTTDKIIDRFKIGTGLDVKRNRPFFVIEGSNYRYDYIRKDKTGRAYIPINGNFNGDAFYDIVDPKKPEEEELKDFDDILEIRDKDGGLFVGNVSNHTRNSSDDKGFNNEVDNNDGKNNSETRRNQIPTDGAIHVKIISEGAYLSNSLSPSFGSGVLSSYNKDGKIYHPLISSVVAYKKRADFYFNPLLSGPYTANQYDKINYETGANSSKYSNDNVTGVGSSPEGGVTSSFIAFFNQGGTDGTDIGKPAPSSVNFNFQELTFNGFASKYNESDRVFGWHNSGVKNDLFKADYNAVKALLPQYTDYGKNRQVLNKRLDNTGELYVPKIEYCVDGIISYSLFGSEFYYFQNNDKLVSTASTLTVGNASKALLFLHCFPFQGVNRHADDTWDRFMFDFNSDSIEESVHNVNTQSPESEILGIKALFRLHNAFIEAPRIWTLFIGAMLWRMNYFYGHGNDPIRWEFPEIKDPLIPKLGKKPRIDEFFSVSLDSDYLPSGMHFYSKDEYPLSYGNITANGTGTYSRIDETIMGLPSQVKYEFISKFLSWANSGEGFKKIQESLEIKFNYVPADINTAGFLFLNNKTGYADNWVKLNNSYTVYPGITNGYALNIKDIVKYLGQNIYDNYIMVAPISSNDLGQQYHFLYYPNGNVMSDDDVVRYVERIKDKTQWHNYNMELNPNGDGMELVVNLLKEKVYIQNLNPHVWNPPNLKNQSIGKVVKQFTPITVSQTTLSKFVDTFRDHFNEISKNLDKEAAKEEDRIQQELFKSMDDDKIKLNIYRTLTAIYSKWIGGLRGDIFSQCTVNDSDMGIANYERNSPKNTRLIESFRFLDRSFNDIGDAFYMNPQVFYNMIVNNRNASFFDIANKVLSDNNFNFIPLPTFVNFNDAKDLADIFEPSPYNNIPVTGPSFVCVYAGQSSTNLDLGENSNYPDDGIFIIVDKNGNIIPETAPDDLMGKKSVNTDGNETISSTLSAYETNLPVFTVNYGQQNQNYFKDIKLDQREFSETAESLEIIDNISQGGDKRKNVMVGQNLFNTYQTRSYSCEIEMLGCALIQPMMYFQLNNIPMFRGLYLIINVSHSIKPNGMSTTFKGVRVKKVKTPLLTASDVLMTLIGDVSNVNTSGGSSRSIITNADRNQVAKVVAKRLKYHNWCSNCIASFIGDLGRENGWNRNVIFGGHSDPANGAKNLGIISWQGERRTKLITYMESKGHMPNGINGAMNKDDAALSSMVDYLLFYDPSGVKKSRTYKYPTPPSSSGTNVLKNSNGSNWTKADFKDNNNSTLKCSQALWAIISYCFSCQKDGVLTVFNTEDSKFFSVNNHTYSKRAKDLGIVNYDE